MGNSNKKQVIYDVDFVVGDECYYSCIKENISDPCRICKGNKTVRVVETDIKLNCPGCFGSGVERKYRCIPTRCQIQSLRLIDTTVGMAWPNISYDLKEVANSHVLWSIVATDIFKDLESCQLYCDLINSKANPLPATE